VAESAIAHLHGPRRLRMRWESRDDMHDAFLQLAHCMILARKLPAF
ncbi:IS5/IS1182 family transposase, partial [Streptomyces sp. 8ZJF_21]|nr:IS5/IS1182 family transposase [Streptomyces malaysiensis]MCD9593092.1 IS5/IS1182 family transposase [Streptomyces sp. 8ZJF_21]